MTHVLAHLPPELYGTGKFPAPPYGYNDSRILYNEHCFLYDGYFDYFCLFPQSKKTRGYSGAKASKKPWPQPEVVELLFKTDITHAENSIQEIKKFAFDKRAQESVNIITRGYNISYKDPKKSKNYVLGELKEVKLPFAYLFSEKLTNSGISLKEKKLAAFGFLRQVKPRTTKLLKFTRLNKIMIKPIKYRNKQKNQDPSDI